MTSQKITKTIVEQPRGKKRKRRISIREEE